MTTEQEIQQVKSQLVYNRSRIMKRAWFLFKNNEFSTLGQAISFVCKENREFREAKRDRLAVLDEMVITTQRNKMDVQPHVEYWMMRDRSKQGMRG